MNTPKNGCNFQIAKKARTNVESQRQQEILSEIITSTPKERGFSGTALLPYKPSQIRPLLHERSEYQPPVQQNSMVDFNFIARLEKIEREHAQLKLEKDYTNPTGQCVKHSCGKYFFPTFLFT